MRTKTMAHLGFCLLASACGSDGGRDGSGGPGITSAGSGIGTDSSGATQATGPSSSTDDGSGGTNASSDGLTDGLKFDIGSDTDGHNPDTGQGMGCQKIDFLFVVDNSGSMSEEQQALANSFPGFVSSIQNTVMAKDYHIMVIDTDAGGNAAACDIICQLLPDCNGIPCNMLPPPPGGCDAALGAGITKNPSGQDCGVAGGNRYMVDGQPNLGATFDCAAKVGTSGDGNERPMEAMIEAITTLNGAAACNEGFLRNDALLVVTFITDEEDSAKSAGNPASWKNALVNAKGGVESSVVVLGLIGDPDQPNAVCPMGQADASPNLRTFAESFQYGSWSSICEADYAPFFDAAVAFIDTACDDFKPPG